MLARRTFLAATAALTLPRPAFAATPALTAASRQIQVLGRAATVFGITNAAGGNGLTAREGARGRPLHRHRAAMTRATI